MRARAVQTTILALTLGLSAANAACADSAGPSLRVLSGAPWSAAPTSQAMASAFPRSAVGKVAEAHVVLRCDFTGDGRLSACATVSETPAGAGFAHAAYALTRDFRLASDADRLAALDANGDVRIDVPFDFRDPSRAAPPPVIADPLWVKRPSIDDAAKAFPAAALKAGYSEGHATVACAVAHDGTLKDCAPRSESPAGVGFGEAGVRIAGHMAMSPWTASGAPVDGAQVVLPLRFEAP